MFTGVPRNPICQLWGAVCDSQLLGRGLPVESPPRPAAQTSACPPDSQGRQADGGAGRLKDPATMEHLYRGVHRGYVLFFFLSFTCKRSKVLPRWKSFACHYGERCKRPITDQMFHKHRDWFFSFNFMIRSQCFFFYRNQCISINDELEDARGHR